MVSSEAEGKILSLQSNFYLFSFLFSIVHATVDGVLAFAAAELGRTIGSYSGFLLYVTYTLTSLLLAKSFLMSYTAKRGVLFGLCGMLAYVISFFLAILFRPAAMPLFLSGAAIGGIGAGILWPSQGLYFSSTAQQVADLKTSTLISTASSVAFSDKCDVYSPLSTANSEPTNSNKPNNTSIISQNKYSNPSAEVESNDKARDIDIEIDFGNSSLHSCVEVSLEDENVDSHHNRHSISIDNKVGKRVQINTVALTAKSLLEQDVTTSLSGTFAAFYLGIESVFKMLATGVYLYYLFHQTHKDGDNTNDSMNNVHHHQQQKQFYHGHSFVVIDSSSMILLSVGNSSESSTSDSPAEGYNNWRSISFGLYSVSAFTATIFFIWKAKEVNWKSKERNSVYNGIDNRNKSSKSNILDINNLLSVINLLLSSRTIQLLLPYQICFGMSTGFIDTYVNRVLVATYIGDGYIGALTAIATISAAFSSIALAYLVNRWNENNNSTLTMVLHDEVDISIKNDNKANKTIVQYVSSFLLPTKLFQLSGKCYVMLLGGFCFLIGPLAVLLLPELLMGNWFFLVFFFIIHGIARGVWESTNKAIVADLFRNNPIYPSAINNESEHYNQNEISITEHENIAENENEVNESELDREGILSSAYSAIYFSSGIAGAFGFLVNQFMSKFVISLVNTLISLIAIVCFYKCVASEPSMIANASANSSRNNKYARLNAAN